MTVVTLLLSTYTAASPIFGNKTSSPPNGDDMISDNLKSTQGNIIIKIPENVSSLSGDAEQFPTTITTENQSEAGIIEGLVAPSHFENQSAAGTYDPFGYVVVRTYISGSCNDNTTRCLLTPRDFRVQPYIFEDNVYSELGSGFPGSENGRTVRIFAPEGSFVQYDIIQEDRRPDFNVYYSNCEGRISAGDQLFCYIENHQMAQLP